MANTFKSSSQYHDTPIKDFYLDIMVERTITKSSNDRLYKIEPKYHKRPDLLANELYGSPSFWWVFAIRNKNELIDPVEDFVSGLEIYLPVKENIVGT